MFGTLDGYVIALDAQTGKEVWVVKHAHPGQGRDHHAGADHRERQGHHRLRRRRIRGARPSHGVQPGRRQEGVGMPIDRQRQRRVPDAEHQQEASGVRHGRQGSRHPAPIRATSGSAAAERRGAGMPTIPTCTWSTTRTGNPGLWSPSYRCGAKPLTQENCNSGKSDNKWSMSIFARNVDTGEAEWVYQMTPFDQWDYDGINEVVLVDIERRRQEAQDAGALRPQRLRLCARSHRRHAAARPQVRHRELGREGRHEDRPSGQGGRALAAQGGRQYPGLPVRDGRQGPAAGGGRSERSRPTSMCRPTTGAWKSNRRSVRTRSREPCTCSPTCTCIRKSPA